eukprot:1798464-Amphidinium_carterae.2
MPTIYRKLRHGMDARIKKIATQPNYGRGIPVLELDNSDLTKQYNNHMVATTKFLTVITGKEEGVGGVLASTPAQEPQIIEQTKRRVGVTLTPGPAVTSKEFASVDLILVDQAAIHQPVRDITLGGNTVMSTLRVRGIAIESPLKAKKKLGVRSLYRPPDEVDTVSVYVDYLQAKGIASEGAIRYPTREFYKERFLVPSSQPLPYVTQQALVAEGEGVDVENKALNVVEGMWILNGYFLKGDDGNVVRHLKILEVGPEGPPRRASLVRKADPARFNHPKWNGSPECLKIGLAEYYVQFLYMNRNGKFMDLTYPGALEAMRLLRAVRRKVWTDFPMHVV